MAGPTTWSGCHSSSSSYLEWFCSSTPGRGKAGKRGVWRKPARTSQFTSAGFEPRTATFDAYITFEWLFLGLYPMRSSFILKCFAFLSATQISLKFQYDILCDNAFYMEKIIVCKWPECRSLIEPFLISIMSNLKFCRPISRSTVVVCIQLLLTVCIFHWRNAWSVIRTRDYNLRIYISKYK